jgi:hypothetical protein
VDETGSNDAITYFSAALRWGRTVRHAMRELGHRAKHEPSCATEKESGLLSTTRGEHEEVPVMSFDALPEPDTRTGAQSLRGLRRGLV